MKKDIAGMSGREQGERIRDFFRALAICHSVTPEKLQDGTVKFSASSPDDEALVCGAKYFGYFFKDRIDGKAIIETPNGKHDEYQVLDFLEFTSGRKRMSVIVRTSRGKILMYSKGADSHMLPRLSKGQDANIAPTMRQVNRFAKEGLRTLIVAYKEIDERSFSRFHEKYEAAQCNLAEIEKRKHNDMNNAIDNAMSEMEQGLTLLGATAIEDKLQDGVPETIASLLEASIKVWVLTGDKVDTAKNIAVACQLIRMDMTRIEITMEQIEADCEKEGIDFAAMSKAEALAAKRAHMVEAINHWREELREMAEAKELRHVLEKHSVKDEPEEEPNPVRANAFASDEESGKSDDKPDFKDYALVIDNVCLHMAEDPEIQPLLLELSLQCAAVVACRVSPKQKQEVVEMVKTGVPDCLSLAIGDGANDVAMIKAAHIGIGISGQEGMQAVNASDYAIAQFAYLKKLLLAHGRFNYRRVAKLTLYIFYKNLLSSSCLFWYAFSNAFSGQKFFPEGGIQLYNILYTNLPALLLGIFDQDVKTSSALSTPTLYTPGISNTYFNNKLFWQWLCEAIVEAAMITYLPFFFIRGTEANLTSLWEYGTMCFITVVFTANLKIFFQQYMWVWFEAVAFVFTVGSLFATLLVYESELFLWFDWEYHKVFSATIREQQFWVTFFGFMVIIIGREVYAKGYTRAFHPTPYQIVQEIDMLGGSKIEEKTVQSKLRKRAPSLVSFGIDSFFKQQEIKRRESVRLSLRHTIAGVVSDGATSPSMELSPVRLSGSLRGSMEGLHRFRGAAKGIIAANRLRAGTENGFSYSYDPETVMAEKMRILTGRARKITADAFWASSDDEGTEGSRSR